MEPTGSETEIEVEAIMDAIREKIAAQKNVTSIPPDPPAPGPLSPAYYKQLHEARLAHDQLEPSIQMTPMKVPVVGSPLNSLRQKLHELILFYVNQLAANQIRFNTHILKAMEELGREVEQLKGEVGEEGDQPSVEPDS